MAVLCKMNQLRSTDFEGLDFHKAIRLTTNHEDEIIDSPEARVLLKKTLERLEKEKSESNGL